MYDPRQVGLYTYPQQPVFYNNSPTPYTQQPPQYVPQQMVQQPQPRPAQNQTQEKVYDIRARHISSPEDIQLGEIPMDGSMPLFMMADRSAIVGKFWDKDAQLKTIRYLPEVIQELAPVQQVPMVQTVIDPDISNRLDKLEGLVQKCLTAVSNIPVQTAVTTSVKPKKEASSNA